MTTLLVTGGAGFIGSNFVHLVRRLRPDLKIVNIDALTYAGNLASLAALAKSPQHTFIKGDITRPEDVRAALATAGPNPSVVHFAAESHVDRSIRSSVPFLETNVVGTQVLLDAAREHGVERFVHVSTDEVYGSLPDDRYADEEAKLNPTNPYSASKAASDHLVLAAVNTHGIPALITRCSNNFGPYQFPEKFIPLVIANAMEDKRLPLYGDGLNERDWIAVEDHCEAVLAVLERGRIGQIYNVAGGNHRTNLGMIRAILDELGRPESLIEHVSDRPGHDRRYAPDDAKIRAELGWKPTRDFEPALRETIRWYRENGDWLDLVRSGDYRRFYEEQYGK
ncbi:MAG: dTDP-glucose 4,6-dehydratase [Planctomycetota bacterium]|jgi:dTDP-glucose 4,6-dehydratase